MCRVPNVPQLYILLLVAIIATLIIDALSTKTFQCSAHFDSAKYAPDEICRQDIEMYKPKANSSHEYRNCRVLDGYLSLQSLRHKVVFPKLEVITGFLYLHDITTEWYDDELSEMFPTLKAVLGQRRIMNLSLLITQYDSHSRLIRFRNLQRVCGPIKVDRSPTICFRYSKTYWNLLEHYKASGLFGKMAPPLPRDDLEITQRNSLAMNATFNFHYNISKRTLMHSDLIRVSIFMLDPVFYRFVQDGRMEKTRCTVDQKKKEKNSYIILSDLDSSDKVLDNRASLHTRLLNHSLDLSLVTDVAEVTTPPELTYDHRIDTFDIRQIKVLRIDEFNATTGSTSYETFEFKFSHFYFIKIEFCPDKTHYHCQLHQHYMFLPTSEEFGPRLIDGMYITNVIKWPRWLMLLAVILVFAVVAIFLYRKYRPQPRRSNWRKYNVDVVSSNPGYGLLKQESSMWWNMFHSNGFADSIDCEINRSKLLILPHRMLGKGEFGFVHEGILFDYDLSTNSCLNCPCSTNSATYPHQSSMRVAIKQLKQDAKQIDKEKFITEAKYMKTFNSNFLVKLVGICSIEEPYLVIMEYMENGDLKRFLRDRYLEYQQTHNCNLLPSSEGVTRLAIQIADGMHYLHSKKVIHRDLAARNCMVGADLNVKIGDFGLTRDLYEKDYYRLSEEAPMPLRWMAPESVSKMIFTSGSDVWSYGVVLWEIMSFGDQPYKGKSDQEVKRLISSCERLQRPMHYIENIGANHKPTPICKVFTNCCWQLASKYHPDHQLDLPRTNFRRDTDVSIQFSSTLATSGSNAARWTSTRPPYRSSNRYCCHNPQAHCKHHPVAQPATSSPQSANATTATAAAAATNGSQFKNRFPSSESLQSAVCSEITTITSLSSNYERKETSNSFRLPTTDEEVALL